MITVSMVRSGDDDRVELLGELTTCPHLVIVPTVTPEGRLAGGWQLVHAPTGLRLPGPWGVLGYDNSVDALRRIGAAVADLDWSSPDPTSYAGVHLQRYRDALRSVELVEDRSTELAERDPDGQIPTTGVGQLGQLLRSYHQQQDRLLGNEPDPMASTDPRWPLVSALCVALYGQIVWLTAVHRLDPEVADSVAARLAEDLEAGESMGEWVWQWTTELAQGEPLTLRGVPSPVPAVLFPGAVGGGSGG